MSGKTKLDITKSGLVAYFDAGNTRSNVISGSSVSNIQTIPVVSKNIAKNYEKLYTIGKSDFLVAKDTSKPTYQTNNYGVLSFDGNNDYLLFWPEANLQFNTQQIAFTFSIWFYVEVIPSSVPYTIIIFVDIINDRRWFVELQKPNINMTISISDDSNFLGTLDGEIENQKWYNLTIVNNPNNVSTLFYINGELNTKALEYFGGRYVPIYIGTSIDTNANFFNGKISNILIYNRELSSTEILQNYNALAYRFPNQIGQLII